MSWVWVMASIMSSGSVLFINFQLRQFFKGMKQYQVENH